MPDKPLCGPGWRREAPSYYMMQVLENFIKRVKPQDEPIVNEDPILGGYYGYEWPMLWPPKISTSTTETILIRRAL